MRTLRLMLLPPPQVLLQALHSLHKLLLDTQSTGQAKVLQAFFWAVAGHFLPPRAASATTLRERLCLPPPQVLVHLDHFVQALVAQSTGQGFLLHGLDSLMILGHLAPPNKGEVVIVRDFLVTPEPQDLEQVLHLLQPVTTQSTGQAWVLHLR